MESNTATSPAANTEQTLILIKPDALKRNLIGALIQRFETAGLKVRACRWIVASRSLLAAHYADLQEKNSRAFNRTVDSLAGEPFLALALEGPDAIIRARSLIGPTDPSKAAPGTIRGDFGTDTIELADRENRATHNLVHAADSLASAQRELALWFT